MSTSDPNSENLRTEYTALSSYYNTVVTFRFTTLGFFLASVGLIVNAPIKSCHQGTLLLLITIGLWIVELRNRSLFRCLANRAIQIERDCWGYKHFTNAYHPYYSRMFKDKPDPEGDPTHSPTTRPRFEKTRIFGLSISHPVSGLFSHTIGIDIIYAGIVGYAIYRMAT